LPVSRDDEIGACSKRAGEHLEYQAIREACVRPRALAHHGECARFLPD
jgi:hypothetical protein